MKEAKKVKNIIFLKEIESNLIDEAIIILNKNINLENINKKSKFLNSDMMIKEAKNIINNYSEKLELKNKTEKILKKNKVLKKVNIIMIFISIIFAIL